jgi:hypothetical protein
MENQANKRGRFNDYIYQNEIFRVEIEIDILSVFNAPTNPYF